MLNCILKNAGLIRIFTIIKGKNEKELDRVIVKAHYDGSFRNSGKPTPRFVTMLDKHATAQLQKIMVLSFGDEKRIFLRY